MTFYQRNHQLTLRTSDRSYVEFVLWLWPQSGWIWIETRVYITFLIFDIKLLLLLTFFYHKFTYVPHNKGLNLSTIDLIVFCVVQTDLQRLLVSVLVPAGPSPITTWPALPQPVVPTVFTLSPHAGGWCASYILSMLRGWRLLSVMEHDEVTPPATLSLTNMCPERSCSTQQHAFHVITC